MKSAEPPPSVCASQVRPHGIPWTGGIPKWAATKRLSFSDGAAKAQMQAAKDPRKCLSHPSLAKGLWKPTGSTRICVFWKIHDKHKTYWNIIDHIVSNLHRTTLFCNPWVRNGRCCLSTLLRYCSANVHVAKESGLIVNRQDQTS